MVSTFKENPNGGFYCSECRMSFGEPYASCPYCNSLITNFEDLIVRANLPTNPPAYETLSSPSGVSRGQRAKTLCIDDFFYSDDLKTALKEYMEAQNERNLS